MPAAAPGCSAAGPVPLQHRDSATGKTQPSRYGQTYNPAADDYYVRLLRHGTPPLVTRQKKKPFHIETAPFSRFPTLA